MSDPQKVFDAYRAYKREVTGQPLNGLDQADVDDMNTALARAEARWRGRGRPTASAAPAPVHGGAPAATGGPLAWGAKVSATFRDRVRWIASELGFDPNDLMACMAWESGRSFSPSKRNLAGSGATGLIQFMPATARGLGTTTDKLAAMTAEDQLNFVFKYFEPMKGKLHNLADLYMAILWPKAVGKPMDYVLWERGKMPTTYRQNAGLDSNRDGAITKAECSAKLYAMKAEGLRPENVA